MRDFARTILGSLGYQVAKNKQGYFKDLFSRQNFDLLIDVGANRGQFLSFIRSAGYAGPAVAFEPIAEHKAEIERHGNVQVYSHAVGARQGAMDLNIYSSTDMSSFYSLKQPYTSFWGGQKVDEVRTIEISPLDELNLGGSSIFLKIDTQGGDADVLRGATKTLHNVKMLLLEIPFMQIYDGGASVGELFSLTHEAGFYPTRLFPVSATDYGAWVDADLLFIRNPAA